VELGTRVDRWGHIPIILGLECRLDLSLMNVQGTPSYFETFGNAAGDSRAVIRLVLAAQGEFTIEGE
jgi:hypothetical protein